MNSNVFSIEQFLKKKTLKNEFSRHRQPIQSYLYKAKMAFESFYEVSADLGRLEEKCRKLKVHQEFR